MPPRRRRRREPPARRDARIHKHLNQAREYWRKAPVYLADGDLCQAGEKGWGTVAQLTKAMATLRNWEHYDHVAIREAITALAHEMPSEEEGMEVLRGLRVAEQLHGNFYEVHMDEFAARTALLDVLPLLQTLWRQIPEQYAGGVSFDQWLEEGE